MATEHGAAKAKAGAASGAARRARVSDRDRKMALLRARLPGRWSYAKLGAEYGMTGAGARKAVARGWTEECEEVDVSRRARVEVLKVSFTLSPKDRLLAALAEAGDNCTCGLRQAVSDFLTGLRHD